MSKVRLKLVHQPLTQLQRMLMAKKISVTPSLEYPAKLVDLATGSVTNAQPPSNSSLGEGTCTALTMQLVK